MRKRGQVGVFRVGVGLRPVNSRMRVLNNKGIKGLCRQENVGLQRIRVGSKTFVQQGRSQICAGSYFHYVSTENWRERR